MSFIVLTPALFSIWVISRRSASAAFFDVWLPCMMLLPTYYYFHVKHLPAMIWTDFAGLPILVVIVALYMKKWEWRLMDLWLLLFVGLFFLSEARHSSLIIAIMQTYGGLSWCLFPYICGRLFIEQPGGRSKFVQRFLVLLSVVTLLSVWDFIAGVSMFQRCFGVFFPGQEAGWPVQTRWGFGRIAGPYAQSILAGMMFLIGVLLCTGMRHFAPNWGRRKVVSFLPLTTRAAVMTLVIAGLLMTQSRGPVAGLLAGVIVVQIARATNMRRAVIVVTIVMLVALSCSYVYLQRYTAGELTDHTSLEQQNVMYRAHLFDAYKQIMIDGGLLGWGLTNYPKPPDLDSIDNEYLFLAVTHGYLGLAVFLAICIGTLGALVRMMPFATEPQDKWLLFTLISIFIALYLTLTSVFLAAQVFQMFFLMVGWVQALRTPAIVALQAERRAALPAVRVFT